MSDKDDKIDELIEKVATLSERSNNFAQSFLSHEAQDKERHDVVMNKLDGITEVLATYKDILSRNTSSLEVHIHRTNLLEDELKDTNGVVVKLDDYRKEQESVNKWFKGKAKLVVLVATVVSSIGGLFMFAHKLLKLFHG